MSTVSRTGAFAVGLVVVFGAALGLGHLSGVRVAEAGSTHSGSMQAGHDSSHGSTQVAAAGQPAGLSVTQEGFSLHLAASSRSVGETAPFTFTIRDSKGDVVRTYTKTHDRDLHLIVVRRDLSSFQHLHPTRAADGTWSVPLTLSAPGIYKVYADFAPGKRTTALVLAADVTVPGSAATQAIAADTTTATTDGDTVTLAGDLMAGDESALTFTVTRAGAPVTLEPYLGAFGHLVVIRAADLAYLHVHPQEDTGLHFAADVPTAGTYRAFLDYQHDGVVRTAAFTVTAH